MSTILYLDLQAGVAGDMLLGAIVDAGADRDFVFAQLDVLALEGWTLEFEETRRAGIRGLKARVLVEPNEKPRTYREVQQIVTEGGLAAPVEERALEAFHGLAKAESAVHGTSLENTHFHEVGATDAIVDVVGSLAALHSLDVDKVIASPVAVGRGRVDTSHGRLPVPAPATLEILTSARVPIVTGGEGELATPTGAALLTVLADEFGPLPSMTPSATGHGAGARDRSEPNIVRAILGSAEDSAGDRVVVETNLDDMSPELFPYVIERLLEAGADDAWVTPIVMKKGRPAFTFSVLTTRDRESDVARVLFKETTTLGLRTSSVQKETLRRDWVLVEVAGHPIQVKIAHFQGKVSNAAPEYEDAAAAARASGISLREVYARAVEIARDQLMERS